ncbi:hypothetical protein ACTXT7_002780 [Hymenolepis weldensis]
MTQIREVIAKFIQTAAHSGFQKDATIDTTISVKTDVNLCRFMSGCTVAVMLKHVTEARPSAAQSLSLPLSLKHKRLHSPFNQMKMIN